MADISLRRHQSIFDPSNYQHEIHIIGVGATGSRAYAALVELGCINVHCYDPDIVEDHNLANQLYTAHDVGEHKTASCAKWYEYKTGRPPPKQMRFHPVALPHEKLLLSGFVFLLTDTMASRREIYETCIEKNPMIEGVIETRMASSHGNVLTFDPRESEQAQAWLDTLIDDGDAEVSPCGGSISVGTTASIIANIAVWQYMLMASNPIAASRKINLFLKPFMTSGD